MVIFCITCKGRVQHLEKTLHRNLDDNPGDNCKFVLLDYNSPDHLRYFLANECLSEIESDRLVVYSYSGEHPFRMAHAKNMAHRCGILEDGSVLVNLDADNLTGPGFADYISAQFTDNEDMFLWSKMIQSGPDRLPRGISGRIVVSKKAFVHSGGYDERFDTWSPDDKDFNLRLRRLGFEGQEIDPVYLNAVLHNDKMRFKEYKHAATPDGCESFESVNDIETTIANYGNFGCGTVYRNFISDPIELKPLPTRIFGIGTHKTATTSLHAALKILGYDSAHWKSAHWAKAIWDQMKASGRSLTLEQHYALCDLPISLLYKELDLAYPGSKFILTVRDEDAWIASVRNHWDPELNQFRAAWDHDPFSHKVHKLIYGQKGFNEELFRRKYREHNADVRLYFSGRPEDLLTMDMDRSSCNGWVVLCNFLDQPIPDVSYPRKFVTREN